MKGNGLLYGGNILGNSLQKWGKWIDVVTHVKKSKYAIGLNGSSQTHELFYIRLALYKPTVLSHSGDLCRT